jgi:hypothetical protein
MADSTVLFNNKFINKKMECISDYVKKNNIDYGDGTSTIKSKLFYKHSSGYSQELALPIMNADYPDEADL